MFKYLLAVGLLIGIIAITVPAPPFLLATPTQQRCPSSFCSYLPLLTNLDDVYVNEIRSPQGAGGSYFIMGTVQNNSTAPLSSATIKIFTEGDNYTTTTVLPVTLPGQTNYFAVYPVLGKPPTHLTAQVVSYTHDLQNHFQPLTVVSTQPNNDYTLGSVSGSIRNDGDAHLDNVMVLAIFRDTADELVGLSSGSKIDGLPITLIQPGEIVDYYIPASPFRFYPMATVTVYAQGERTPEQP